MAQVIDPVCGMTIDSATAAGRTTYESHDYYFCLDQCLRSFRPDPDRYAGAERHEPPYTAGDVLAAPKFGSAGSGGLEHEMPPERHDRP
jgi:Cu+-exporting ATPase